MANVNGIFGYNKKTSSTDILLASYGYDVVNVATGVGYGLALNGNDVEMEGFLDSVFLQNYNATPITFTGSTWGRKYVSRTMIAKFLKPFKSRMYLANCKFPGPQAPNDADGNAILFPSHVFYSDPFIGNSLTWGLDWGTNGVTTSGTPYFTLSGGLPQDFIANNIKVGDPLFITNGNAQLTGKYYTVAEIKSSYCLRVTDNFPVTATSLHYWVGSNFFPVGTDDGDEIKALYTHANDVLLIPKTFSLYYYTGSRLVSVPDSLGTSSARSLLSFGGKTYYFHGSDPQLTGMYAFDGVRSPRISRPIDPFIIGMSQANYPSVVGWIEGERLRWYIGPLSNANQMISITNAVSTFDTTVDAWDVGPIAHRVTCRTQWLTGDRRDTYCGTSSDEVMKMGSGNSHNGTPISMYLQTRIIYPAGTDTYNTFKRVKIIGRQARGIKVRYRLWDTPKEVGNWEDLGECSGDSTELIIPAFYSFGSGIEYAFYESGSLENDTFIEKITTYYDPQQKRVPQMTTT